MKMFVYSLREYDERRFFDNICGELGIEYDSTPDVPTPENIGLAEGFDVINIITCPIDEERIKALKEAGVKLIMSRTVGTDHIDKDAAARYGIPVMGISYSPNAVADYAIMLMLMGCRRLKYIQLRTIGRDYGLYGRLGKELRECTVGLYGGGDIGKTVARQLSGFGCRILICDRHPDEETSGYAEYVDRDILLSESDIISLHLSGTPENFHIIGEKEFSMMKDGVMIINTARGLLIDTKAMIDAIESGKIGFAGLDVIENEKGMYYFDHEDRILTNKDFSILNGYPNVIVLPHMAFYTEPAVRDMVVNSTVAAKKFFDREN